MPSSSSASNLTPIQKAQAAAAARNKNKQPCTKKNTGTIPSRLTQVKDNNNNDDDAPPPIHHLITIPSHRHKRHKSPATIGRTILQAP
mmetsp:Transcript_51167/g.61640  ORF Transcript_51167/g.61640 Transcript_51167/m.61640 type:complete len:88 (+) Transcript_51167:67-330(+)